MSELDEEAEDPVVELIVGSGEPERELAKLLMLLSTLCVDKEPTPDPSMRSPTTAPPAALPSARRSAAFSCASCLSRARRSAISASRSRNCSSRDSMSLRLRSRCSCADNLLRIKRRCFFSSFSSSEGFLSPPLPLFSRTSPSLVIPLTFPSEDAATGCGDCALRFLLAVLPPLLRGRERGRRPSEVVDEACTVVRLVCTTGAALVVPRSGTGTTAAGSIAGLPFADAV